MITKTAPDKVQVTPLQFELWYGNRVVYSFAQPDYQHPADERPARELPVTPLTGLPVPDLREVENKIGVLVTRAQSQPHTTVLAFLSSDEDDIFFITFPETFKSQLLKRDGRCHFAIDSRAVFTYTRAIEWNYTIIAADAYQIRRITRCSSPSVPPSCRRTRGSGFLQPPAGGALPPQGPSGGLPGAGKRVGQSRPERG